MPTSKTLAAAGPLTQKQIADELGVSRQLVGFALRGKGRMSDEVRRGILEAARSNGYHQYSNREARSMVSRRYGKRAATGVLAVLFEATFENQPLSNVPFFVPFFEGLETEAISRRMDLVLCPVRPGELPRLVSERQVDGLVCLATPHEFNQRMAQLDLPLVSIFYPVEGCPSLEIDNAGGAALAARHLMELGHKRIAYICLERQMAATRLASFRATLDQNGLLDEALIAHTDATPSIATGQKLMRELLSRGHSPELPFTSLACYNDLMAIGAVEVLQEAGYRVPDDVSVVGFDDVSLKYPATPALTSVNFSRQDIGKRAIHLLCQTGAESPNANLNEIFPVELVQRASTRPLVMNS